MVDLTAGLLKAITASPPQASLRIGELAPELGPLGAAGRPSDRPPGWDEPQGAKLISQTCEPAVVTVGA